MPEWVDTFLFWTVLVVIFFSFIDWVMGEEKRQEMRERVGDFWLHLSDVTFEELVVEDIGKFVRFLRGHLGQKFLSKQRLVRTFIVSTVITLATYVILNLLMPEMDTLKDMVTAYLVVIIPNFLSDWLSLGFTIYILEKMAKQRKLVFYLLVIVLDLAAAAALVYGSVFLFNIMGEAIASILGVGDFINWLFDVSPGFLAGLGEAIFISLLIAAASFLPSFLHILYTVTLIFLKLFRFALQGPVMIVLLRFHESRKGVLTNISIALGASAKIIQETVKHLSAGAGS